MLDASAGLYVASSARGFGGLANHELHAPQLFWSETISAIHQRRWRGVISDDLAATARRAVLDAPVTGHADHELYERAWSVADRAGWAKTYDAEYVALAELLAVPLVTRDERLARGAERFVRVLAPGQLEISEISMADATAEAAAESARPDMPDPGAEAQSGPPADQSAE